jgi:putative transposase
VKLPKLGWVKFRGSRSLDGEAIRSATVSREGGHWFVSSLVDDGVSTPKEHGAAGACRETTAPAGAVVASTQEPAGNREELLHQPV